MSKSEPETKADDSAVPAAAAGATAGTTKPGLITRILGTIWHLIEGKLFPGPVGRTVVALLLMLIGVAGGEAYQYARDYFIDPDEEVKALAKKQSEAFGKLDDELASLRGAVDSNGRKTLSAIEETVARLKDANAALVVKARDSSDRAMGRAAPAASSEGIYSGEMVAVQGSGSIVIDDSTSIGIQGVSNVQVTVRVSSLADDNESTKYLRVGEYVSYRRGDGRACKTTVIAILPENKATLRTACASQ